jgi:hypothetical protein
MRIYDFLYCSGGRKSDFMAVTANVLYKAFQEARGESMMHRICIEIA